MDSDLAFTQGTCDLMMRTFMFHLTSERSPVIKSAPAVIKVLHMIVGIRCAFLLAKKPFFVRMLHVEKRGLLDCSSFCERLPFNLYYTSAIEHSGYLRVEDSISVEITCAMSPHGC